MEHLLNKLKEISDFFVRIDRNLGFLKVVKYVALVLIVIGICNFRSVVKSVVEVVSEITEEQHTEKMQLRDELIYELQPMLNEIRAHTRADRVLYFEYHNSKENLVGIPFKYADLVLQASSYNVINAPEGLYKDINTGAIANLYEKLKHEIVCSDDSLFCYNYPGTYELFNGNDGSIRQVFVSIPGVDQPIGMLVFEWVIEDQNMADVKWIEYVLGSHGGNYLSRINGLVMSKANK